MSFGRIYSIYDKNKKLQKNFQKVAEYIGVESIVGMTPYDMGFNFVHKNKEKQ